MTNFDIPWQSGVDIRRKFVEFFESKGHRQVPSSSLVLAEGVRRTWPRSTARFAATGTVRPRTPQTVTGD